MQSLNVINGSLHGVPSLSRSYVSPTMPQHAKHFVCSINVKDNFMVTPSKKEECRLSFTCFALQEKMTVEYKDEGKARDEMEPLNNGKVLPKEIKECKEELNKRSLHNTICNIFKPPKDPKMVKVIFMLYEKCEFDQFYSVVGSAPEVGEWDPKKSIPLTQIEDEVWMSEVEIPLGKRIEFKFALVDKRGETSLQPGKNRVIEIGEGDTILFVRSVWKAEGRTVQHVYGEKEAVLKTFLESNLAADN